MGLGFLPNILPVLNRFVAFVADIRQGSANSRATTAPCDNSPPNSVTNPLNIGKSGVQAVSVNLVIRISPDLTQFASAMERQTRATPKTLPQLFVVATPFTIRMSFDLKFLLKKRFHFSQLTHFVESWKNEELACGSPIWIRL